MRVALSLKGLLYFAWTLEIVVHRSRILSLRKSFQTVQRSMWMVSFDTSQMQAKPVQMAEEKLCLIGLPMEWKSGFWATSPVTTDWEIKMCARSSYKWIQNVYLMCEPDKWNGLQINKSKGGLWKPDLRFASEMYGRSDMHIPWIRQIEWLDVRRGRRDYRHIGRVWGIVFCIYRDQSNLWIVKDDRKRYTRTRYVCNV